MAHKARRWCSERQGARPWAATRCVRGTQSGPPHLGNHALKHGRVRDLREPIKAHPQNAIRHKALPKARRRKQRSATARRPEQPQLTHAQRLTAICFDSATATPNRVLGTWMPPSDTTSDPTSTVVLPDPYCETKRAHAVSVTCEPRPCSSQGQVIVARTTRATA